MCICTEETGAKQGTELYILWDKMYVVKPQICKHADARQGEQTGRSTSSHLWGEGLGSERRCLLLPPIRVSKLACGPSLAHNLLLQMQIYWTQSCASIYLVSTAALAFRSRVEQLRKKQYGP